MGIVKVNMGRATYVWDFMGIVKVNIVASMTCMRAKAYLGYVFGSRH